MADNKKPETTTTPSTPLATALTTALADAGKPIPTNQPPVTIGAPLALIDADNRKDEIASGDGSIERLFTAVHFTPVSGDVYAREKERRNKPTLTTAYSRKVAEVAIECANTGVFTPGTISMVQGVHEATAHLEMSIGVWNPDTRQSSFRCLNEAAKERLQAWKDKTCADFLAQCEAQGIDLSAPETSKKHANAVSVSLLPK